MAVSIMIPPLLPMPPYEAADPAPEFSLRKSSISCREENFFMSSPSLNVETGVVTCFCPVWGVQAASITMAANKAMDTVSVFFMVSFLLCVVDVVVYSCFPECHDESVPLKTSSSSKRTVNTAFSLTCTAAETCCGSPSIWMHTCAVLASWTSKMTCSG